MVRDGPCPRTSSTYPTTCGVASSCCCPLSSSGRRVVVRVCQTRRVRWDPLPRSHGLSVEGAARRLRLGVDVPAADDAVDPCRAVRESARGNAPVLRQAARHQVGHRLPTRRSSIPQSPKDQTAVERVHPSRRARSSCRNSGCTHPALITDPAMCSSRAVG